MCAYGLTLRGETSEIYYFIIKLVTLFVRLLWRTERFPSTFSLRTEISAALRFCFLGLGEVVGEAAMIV